MLHGHVRINVLNQHAKVYVSHYIQITNTKGGELVFQYDIVDNTVVTLHSAFTSRVTTSHHASFPEPGHSYKVVHVVLKDINNEVIADIEVTHYGS